MSNKKPYNNRFRVLNKILYYIFSVLAMISLILAFSITDYEDNFWIIILVLWGFTALFGALAYYFNNPRQVRYDIRKGLYNILLGIDYKLEERHYKKLFKQEVKDAREWGVSWEELYRRIFAEMNIDEIQMTGDDFFDT